jgi:hypothetical protein
MHIHPCLDLSLVYPTPEGQLLVLGLRERILYQYQPLV